MIIQTMTGANTIFYYSTTIFGYAGFDDSLIATACVGGVNFFTTLYTAHVIDYYNRKTLLMNGMYIYICM